MALSAKRFHRLRSALFEIHCTARALEQTHEQLLDAKTARVYQNPDFALCTREQAGFLRGLGEGLMHELYSHTGWAFDVGAADGLPRSFSTTTWAIEANEEEKQLIREDGSKDGRMSRGHHYWLDDSGTVTAKAFT